MRAHEFIADSVINGKNNLTRKEQAIDARQRAQQDDGTQKLRDIEDLAQNKQGVRKR